MESKFREGVLGKKYIYDEDVIERVFEDCIEIEYTYGIQESRDAFVEVLDKSLSVEE